MAIAEAIRNGEAVARVPLPLPFSAMIPESPLIGYWLDQLQNDLTVIKIEIHDEKVQQHSEDYLQKQGQRLVDMGRRMLHKKAGGETLHTALDVYSRWIRAKYVDVKKKPTAWCGTQGRQLAFMRRHLLDCPLTEFDAQRVEEMIDTLRLRPNGQDGKPVSVSWTQNCVKQFRRFLRWLNKSTEFAWKRPVDLELSRVHIPRTPGEKSALNRSSQVQTYSEDELKMLWDFASPFQRLLLLLALNGGFGRAEVASLEMAEVLLHQKHPHSREVGYPSTSEDSWIFRLRHKTGVYSEFKLWPETVQAVEWWLRQRTGITIDPEVTTLLVNRNGHRYDTPTKGNHTNFQIPNTWFHLAKQIKKHHPEYRPLSFNKLRKTAGNLIRSAAGGEVAAVFLCHGTPVKADELLELYTNRPFAKVFAALDKVGERLRPLWTSVSEPFPDCSKKQDEADMDSSTYRQIQILQQQGYKTSSIAERLGVSVRIVRKSAKPSPETKEVEGN